MNPQLDESSEKALYDSGYYTGNSDYTYYDERTSERYARYVWNARLNTIRQYIPDGNFLDVGCSFGGFMKAASEYFTVFGIEPSEYSGAYARQRFGDSPIHIGTLSDHSFPYDNFSVITMIEVLEHIKNPYNALVECFHLLKKNGLLVIQTANMDGWQAKVHKNNYGYFLPGHVSYFSKANVTNALYAVGFKKITVFQPVDFGLLPKLMKSRMNVTSSLDYIQWIRIALYHYASKIHCGNFAVTSSMVVYAVK